MDILLSHTTALTLLHEHGDRTFTRSTRAMPAPSRSPRRDDLYFLGDDQLEAEVLVGQRSASRATGGIRTHLIQQPIPAGGVLTAPRVAGLPRGLRLASPELIFVQLAATLSFAELLLLGFELCGLRCVRPSDGALVERPPLTTPARLRGFISRNTWLRGSRKAAQAARYVLANAGSAHEAAIAIMASLPPRFGGYGMGTPELNPRLEVPDRTRAITTRSVVVPDIFFRDALEDLEYDSKTFHTKATAAENSHRRAVLGHMGIHVTTIRTEELYRADLLDASLRSSAHYMKKRLQNLNSAWEVRRDRLHADLLLEIDRAMSPTSLSSCRKEAPDRIGREPPLHDVREWTDEEGYTHEIP